MHEGKTFPYDSFSADSNAVLNYQRDAENYVTQVFAGQLPAIQTGFFNVHMNKGIIIQPHWHTNANELVFLIRGSVITSLFNPFSRQLLTRQLTPGQCMALPKGWFHWILALTDHVHLLTIFDVPTPDVVFGSDFLHFLPAEIASRAYCINQEAYQTAVAPIQASVILGPPPSCTESKQGVSEPLYPVNNMKQSSFSSPFRPFH